MKIWVDDIRTPPDDWFNELNCYWRTNSKETISFLEFVQTLEGTIDIMSLDHDLGGDDTTRPIVLWMIENNFWPKQVVVHSANPVGREWLEGMIERYKP